MPKSSNFFGQPIYGQLIKSLDREKIVKISRKHGGEKIETSMTAEVRKLHNVGIGTLPRSSTLADANARRS